MLSEKDYCDKDTCVALKKLGYKVPTSAYYMPNNNQLIFVSNSFRGGYAIDCFYSHNSFPKEIVTSKYIDAPTMWEAQKWLREEWGIHITIHYVYHLNEHVFGTTLRFMGKTLRDHGALYDTTKYSTYEEALLEGIKNAVKILKDQFN